MCVSEAGQCLRTLLVGCVSRSVHNKATLYSITVVKHTYLPLVCFLRLGHLVAYCFQLYFCPPEETYLHPVRFILIICNVLLVISLVVGLVAPFHLLFVWRFLLLLCMYLLFFIFKFKLRQVKFCALTLVLVLSHYDFNSFCRLFISHLNFARTCGLHFCSLMFYFRNICLDICRNCTRRMRSSSTDLQRNRD